jgi:hypothetical protein
MSNYEKLCSREEVIKRLEDWANSPEGKARIKKDSETANAFIDDFKRRRNVSPEILNRRVTI